MPSINHKVAGATQLGGADEGLFVFADNRGAVPPGDPRVEIINLFGAVAGTAATWSVELVSPDDPADSVILAAIGTGNSVNMMPAGDKPWLIPVHNGPGLPWGLRVVTADKDGDGFVTVDWKWCQCPL